MKQVRLGIVGIGNMASAYIKMIQSGCCPEIKLTAIADIIPERMEHFAVDAKFDSLTAILNSGPVDAVLITTPHYSHPELAIECFKHNIHVLIDKPAGVYTKQVREMNKAAEKSDVIFGIMFNQRTDHIYRSMKKIISDGTLGQIRRVNWIITDWYRSQVYFDSGAWRATWSGEGGGVLMNQCPHNLDLLQWICGLPIKVDAKLHFGKWHDIEVEDDVTAYMEFENGATGTFITSTGDAPGSNRFEITCEGGKLVAEDGKLKMWELNPFEPEFSRINKKPFGKPRVKKTIVKTDGESTQHEGVLNAFAGAILRGEPLIADGNEGINGLMLVNAMHLSAWMEVPVALPIDENLFYKKLKERIKGSKVKRNITEIVADPS